MTTIVDFHGKSIFNLLNLFKRYKNNKLMEKNKVKINIPTRIFPVI